MEAENQADKDNLPPDLGRGFLKDKANPYPGWDSVEEDKKIEDAFEPFAADLR